MITLRTTERGVPTTPVPAATFCDATRLLDPEIALALATPSRLRLAMRGDMPLPRPLPPRRRRPALALAVAAPLSIGTATAAEPASPPPPVEPAPMPAPPPPDDLSWRGRAIWAGLVGSRVEVVLDDETRLDGIVLAELEGEVALLRSGAQDVVRVPKAMVLGVRVLALRGVESIREGQSEAARLQERKQARFERDFDRAEKVFGTGLGLTIAGASVLTAGVVALGASGGYYAWYGPAIPFFVTSAAFLGPGIPLLVGGAQAKAQLDERRRRAEVGLSMGPTRGGWHGQIAVRF